MNSDPRSREDRPGARRTLPRGASGRSRGAARRGSASGARAQAVAGQGGAERSQGKAAPSGRSERSNVRERGRGGANAAMRPDERARSARAAEEARDLQIVGVVGGAAD